MLDELLELYVYNRWAHERTLAAAASVSAERYVEAVVGSFPSLRATLEHLLAAESVWLDRWQGNPRGQPPDLSACPDVAALRARWDTFWAEQSRFLAALTEADLARGIPARFRDGTEAVQPLGEMLRHVVNHATYHRGQVTTLVRQLGGTPNSTDYIRYCMTRDAARATPGPAPAGAVR